MENVAEVHLGDIELDCLRTALTVWLSCSVRPKSPENGSSTNTGGFLKASLTAATTGEMPWVSYESNFRLVISLTASPDLRIERRNRLGDLLASALWQTGIWTSLELMPTAVENVVSEDNECHTVTTFFDRPVSTNKATARVYHRLGQDVPIEDLSPPDGIANITLECINLVIKIQRTVVKPKFVLGSADIVSNTEGERWPQIARHDHIVSDQFYPRIDIDGIVPRNLLDDDDDEMLDSGSHDVDLFTGESLYEDDRGEAEHISETLDHDVVYVSPLVQVTATNLPQQTSTLDEQQILTVVDTALRHTFFEAASRRSPHTLVKRDTMALKLAAFMPPMWSPGYRPAVASRAVLTPTISHALANFSRIRAKNETRPSEDDASDNGAEPCTLPSQEVLSEMLWKRLQTRLYDPLSSRRLKTFLLNPDSSEVDMSMEDGLLDDQVVGDRAFTGAEDYIDESDEDLFAISTPDNGNSQDSGTDFALAGSDLLFSSASSGSATSQTSASIEMAPSADRSQLEEQYACNNGHVDENDETLSIHADANETGCLHEDALSRCDSLGSDLEHGGDDEMLMTREEQDKALADDRSTDHSSYFLSRFSSVNPSIQTY